MQTLPHTYCLFTLRNDLFASDLFSCPCTALLFTAEALPDVAVAVADAAAAGVAVGHGRQLRATTVIAAAAAADLPGGAGEKAANQ